MISICIPIHEHDVRELAGELEQQMARTKEPVELIFIDDASTDAYRELNRSLASEHQYVELEENVGRSKVRNLLLEYAHYAYLLFLDCDSRIPSEDFLERYIRALKTDELDLICGGRVFRDEAPGKERLLRWKYGLRREQRPLKERQEAPYRAFMTNNFLVHRDLLERIPFEERLSGYGHEDTLFGYRAKQVGAKIRYIDAPVLNDHLETNQEFLKKTEQGVRNLVRIERLSGEDPDLIRDVSLLAFYHRWKGTGLLPLIRAIFLIGKSFIWRRLASGKGGLRLYDLYKLGLLIGFEREAEKGDEGYSLGSAP